MAKIAFCQDLAYEYLGVMHLSAVMKAAGHDVEIFIDDQNAPERARHAFIDELARWAPDILAFPCTTASYPWALRTARACKNTLTALTLFGGPHPTFNPEIVEEPAIDIVCRGEGEATVSEFLSCLKAGTEYRALPGLWVKKDGVVTKNPMRPLIRDLDTLPFPDRDLYARKYPFLKKSHQAVMAGRGCPFDCTYCFNHALKKLYENEGPYIRMRSPENVIREIRGLCANHGARTVHIQDDTFILNKKFLREFCDLYAREIPVPFVCLVRPDLITEEIVQWLKNARCKVVFMGVETGNEELRKRLLKRNITNRDIEGSAALLRRYGIEFRTYNILGFPHETIPMAWETVAINQRINTDYPWCSLLYPYRGTEMGDMIEKEGLLEDTIDVELTSFFKTSVIRSPFRTQLANLHKLFYFAVKLPFLAGLIRQLIKLPENIFFDVLFLASYAWVFWRSEKMNFFEFITAGARSLRGFYFKRK